MDTINVYNRNKFDVGIVKPDGTSLNIRPGSFAILTENEFRWFNSQYNLITSGVLRIDDEKEELLKAIGVNIAENPNAIEPDGMREKLKQSAKNIDAWLATITERYVLDKIYDVAMDMDLPKSKLQILEKYMPDKDVLEGADA